MHAVDFIAKKRKGEQHSREELEQFITGYVRNDIPDYQVAAWLMAVCWQGMTPQEAADLTDVMAQSGDMLDLSDFPQAVDKHSTGGVGDKTSLVLGPLLAACGATVAKMSGRGLGHTGGTIDKLESIPGFRAALSDEAFLAQARDVGIVITGQSKDLAPADGLLYALRDATATVQSLPLIASSIMSKKLASGAKSIVLDVKVGNGAFMKTLDEARELASAMIDIGKRNGRNMRAVLSNMDQPLGKAVGNALEVQEAIDCLRGGGPAELRELCLTLASEVLPAAGLNLSTAEITQALDDGRAFEVFKSWIAAQGGDLSYLDKLELATESSLSAECEGYLSELDALLVGQVVKDLGGGRTQKGDVVDLGVGVVLHAKIGDYLKAGDPLVTVYHRQGRGLAKAKELLGKAISFSDKKPELKPLIFETLA